MMAKFSPCSRSRCAILLAIFALLTCVGAVSVASESNVIKPEALDLSEGLLLRGFRVKRSLRTFVEATKDDDDSEERVSNEFAKKMAQAAKNTFTSNNQATTNKLFKSLQVEETGKELFQSAQFEKWATTVAKNFKKNPEKAPTSMFSTLANYYGDEALAKMIVGAKNSANVGATADKLEYVQLNRWLSEGKTIDDIFKLFKLNKEGEKLLQSPMLRTWISYVDLQGKNPYDLLLVKLSAHYDETGLAKMLVAAKEDGKTHFIARELEKVQLKNWQSDGKSADNVYNLLKLNLDGDDILKNPMLTTWISYTTKLDENPYELLLANLLKHYDDATLTKMFVAAKRSSATGFTGTKLGEAQLKNWLSSGKTADDVFKLLQLNKDGDTILASSIWSVWSSYLTKLDKENADELMFVVLKKHYGDEGVAKIVTVANKGVSTKDVGRKLEEELWRSQGKDGNDVFKLLKLDEEGQKFFESPALRTWISYVTRLNKFNKKSPDVISQLEKRFGDMELARMIGFAKQKASTEVSKKVATQLQDLQFKQWLAARMTPRGLSDKMGLTGFDERNAKVVLNYFDFVTLH
ncbi:hypothetical protein PRIC1_011818 [Phytophthora ramorum]